MTYKRINKVIISGYTKNPEINNGYGIYKYTENGFLDSYSRFCNEDEKPWWVEKYTNNDCGLPIKKECFLMGEYVRYDTYEYTGNNNTKCSVYDAKEGLSSYTEYIYENNKEIEHRQYTKNGELMLYRYIEYNHLGRKSKITRKDLGGEVNLDTVYEYDNDVLLVKIDYYPDGQIIKNQYFWEEKEYPVNVSLNSILEKDDDIIREVLEEYNPQELFKLLKSVNEEVKDKICRSMSKSVLSKLNEAEDVMSAIPPEIIQKRFLFKLETTSWKKDNPRFKFQYLTMMGVLMPVDDPVQPIFPTLSFHDRLRMLY